MLTFSLVSMSGYRVEKLFKFAQERVTTVAVGGSLCVIVSVVICPVWAGADLHSSIVKNLKLLADSLEGPFSLLYVNFSRFFSGSANSFHFALFQSFTDQANQ